MKTVFLLDPVMAKQNKMWSENTQCYHRLRDGRCRAGQQPCGWSGGAQALCQVSVGAKCSEWLYPAGIQGDCSSTRVWTSNGWAAWSPPRGVQDEEPCQFICLVVWDGLRLRRKGKDVHNFKGTERCQHLLCSTHGSDLAILGPGSTWILLVCL